MHFLTPYLTTMCTIVRISALKRVLDGTTGENIQRDEDAAYESAAYKDEENFDIS